MYIRNPWWRHQMETFSASLAICAGNSQRPVTRSFDVFFDLRLNKRLSKQSWGWWFQTLSLPLWRHCNAKCLLLSHKFSHVYLWKPLSLIVIGDGVLIRQISVVRMAGQPLQVFGVWRTQVAGTSATPQWEVRRVEKVMAPRWTGNSEGQTVI